MPQFLAYTNGFDKTNVSSISALEISQKELRADLDALEANIHEASTASSERVHVYHEKQVMQSWQFIKAVAKQ